MKQLVLMRHASAEWTRSGETDAQRILSPDGQAEAREMAQLLAGNNYEFDRVVCSSSARTKETTDILKDVLNFKEITEDDRLYLCSESNHISYIKNLPDTASCVLVVAHNPSTSDVANMLQTKVAVPGLTPGGLVSITFEVDTWKKVDATNGTLTLHAYPRL